MAVVIAVVPVAVMVKYVPRILQIVELVHQMEDAIGMEMNVVHGVRLIVQMQIVKAYHVMNVLTKMILVRSRHQHRVRETDVVMKVIFRVIMDVVIRLVVFGIQLTGTVMINAGQAGM
ncbi:hypothetical protein A2Y99_03535 [Candidatus Gottesmanbacteria bacterium RBG_13_37_7]|uniref:Uncharacterized protein n=1 Tax=Candidatus Gottesmanbacteria bacterium RBG_13_37_7 TaxID=1798369 RepID=A0A1F5YJB8_9BACT|nr:MAG: hypothetical protein A2Y99_03535 [Candidatus Gottesmanbacteria bacterium RBG_13_37_7]